MRVLELNHYKQASKKIRFQNEIGIERVVTKGETNWQLFSGCPPMSQNWTLNSHKGWALWDPPPCDKSVLHIISSFSAAREKKKRDAAEMGETLLIQKILTCKLRLKLCTNPNDINKQCHLISKKKNKQCHPIVDAISKKKPIRKTLLRRICHILIANKRANRTVLFA